MNGMADRLTIGELLMLRIVTHRELQAVIDGFLANPQPGWWEITDGISVDILAAVNAHPHARAWMSQPGATLAAHELAIRTVILLAKPA
ncbi:hypothetical protein [Methylobacterium isbiliense]|uniref:Uncharacterized protein n=1 Tax=Methylobacterium isbiliense TaxID=315478 RepID=A0ABQ4S9W8_9HYPH|nr:hypothetical protein [Methylobacterium isbiliense]MDN3626634.1 hypothetical protein [Methylobacterium isbiliense]GJD99265.1 hypothetical protein GMJLKIPL_1181 [Methylobacterium isbiliense]